MWRSMSNDGALWLQLTCSPSMHTHAHTHTHFSPVSVTIRQGFPVLAVPLPSRNESCDFILRPHLQTVGDFINHVKAEDGGVDRYRSACT